MRYLLALDQGTSSSRALLFDERAPSSPPPGPEEHPQIYPEPGWVEHDPELLWQTQVRTVRRVLEHGVRGRDIAAIGISNQREMTSFGSARAGDRSRTPSSGRTRRCGRTAISSARQRGALRSTPPHRRDGGRSAGREPSVRLALHPATGAAFQERDARYAGRRRAVAQARLRP
ncbi:MAG: FGGY family carbohydrate kinase [Actinomycetota bacterium]